MERKGFFYAPKTYVIRGIYWNRSWIQSIPNLLRISISKSRLSNVRGFTVCVCSFRTFTVTYFCVLPYQLTYYLYLVANIHLLLEEILQKAWFFQSSLDEYLENLVNTTKVYSTPYIVPIVLYEVWPKSIIMIIRFKSTFLVKRLDSQYAFEN